MNAMLKWTYDAWYSNHTEDREMRYMEDHKPFSRESGAPPISSSVLGRPPSSHIEGKGLCLRFLLLLMRGALAGSPKVKPACAATWKAWKVLLTAFLVAPAFPRQELVCSGVRGADCTSHGWVTTRSSVSLSDALTVRRPEIRFFACSLTLCHSGPDRLNCPVRMRSTMSSDGMVLELKGAWPLSRVYWKTKPGFSL